MANLVKKISMKGKKGDLIHIPMPTRGDPSAKAAFTAVTIQQALESEKTVTIDQHWEYSKLIEDIADLQALNSMRKFYVDDAGYALAKRLDTHLIRLGACTNGSTVTAGVAATTTNNVYAEGYIGGDGTTAYTSASTGNASALTDAAIRRTIQRLDDADAPMEARYIVIPPSARNTLMGLARFTEQAFTGESGGGNTIRNGQIGDIYGMPVYVTSNADTPNVASGTKPRAVLIFQRDAFVLAEQQTIRTQKQYKQEYLADLLTSDMVFGTQILRNSTTSGAGDEATAFALIVPA